MNMDMNTMATAMLIAKAIGGGGGGSSVTVEALNVTENGVYSEAGKAFSPITVSVPQYSIASLSVTSNGVYSAPANTAWDIVDVNVSGGGGTDAEDEIIMRTISGTYVNNRVTSIGDYAFAFCTSLQSVSFGSALSIGSHAFNSCSNLTNISFPNVEYIGSYAFASCKNLKSVSFPKVTVISTSAFVSCKSMLTVSFPIATTISGYAFTNCSSLRAASFPNATTIGQNAFANCYEISEVFFPSATSVGVAAFGSCSKLASITLDLVEDIQAGTFSNCYRLSEVYLPRAVSINNAFQKCFHLMSLYLLGSSVANLVTTSAFSSTPIANYFASVGSDNYGSIYVPSSLLTTYQSATNWVNFSDRFVGV